MGQIKSAGQKTDILTKERMLPTRTRARTHTRTHTEEVRKARLNRVIYIVLQRWLMCSAAKICRSTLSSIYETPARSSLRSRSDDLALLPYRVKLHL